VRTVRFTRQAREDLLDLWSYIAERSSEATADKVYDRIEQGCQILKQNPQIGRARPEIAEDARALVIDHWLALYRLTDDGVQIVRIIAGVRDLALIEWPADL